MRSYNSRFIASILSVLEKVVATSWLRTKYQQVSASLTLALFNDATHWTLCKIATSPMVEVNLTDFTITEVHILKGYGTVTVRDTDANLLSTQTSVYVTLPLAIKLPQDSVSIRMIFCDGLFDSVEAVTSTNMRRTAQSLTFR
jgi:hypothetical protein